MICYVDGGYDNIRKRNPYYSYKIYLDDGQLLDWVRMIECGAKTNNEAEYLGLIVLLIRLSNTNVKENITIYSDSKLLVEQVNGRWKIKSDNLKKLYILVDSILLNYNLIWVPRKVIIKELGH